jgi:biopolymer transport protein ExbD
MAGGGSAVQSSGKKKARIEIIPLIDVVFFLLATFVLFTLSLNRIKSVPINLPVSTVDSKPDPDNEPVILQVSDADTVFWNKEPISLNELTPRLLQYRKTAKIPRILVTGDDRGKFGTTVKVLDEVRKANIDQVSIETTWRASGK